MMSHVVLNSIMVSSLLVTVQRTAKTTTSSETHGVLTGVKMVISESLIMEMEKVSAVSKCNQSIHKSEKISKFKVIPT